MYQPLNIVVDSQIPETPTLNAINGDLIKREYDEDGYFDSNLMQMDVFDDVFDESLDREFNPPEHEEPEVEEVDYTCNLISCTDGFWSDIEKEAEEMTMVAPADTIADDADVLHDMDSLLAPESNIFLHMSESSSSSSSSTSSSGSSPHSSGSSSSSMNNDWTITPEESTEHKDILVHHDCMWAGKCRDSKHPMNTFIPSEPLDPSTGRSLLKRSASPMRAAAQSPQRPETPQSLDESEPPRFSHSVDTHFGTALQMLRDSAVVAADHTYSVSKPAQVKHKFNDSLGVQTPSDSEEEIDVVSVEKGALLAQSLSLPHEPSASQTDQLQQRVAEAALMPRPRPRPRPAARKRLRPPAGIDTAYLPPRKRAAVARGPGRRPRRAQVDTDSEAEMPDYEKRSLHNDMERLRRISLKNLFDQLKAVIPSIATKERAPKVTILREATDHCQELMRNTKLREQLRREQDKLKARLRRLRAQVMANCYEG